MTYFEDMFKRYLSDQREGAERMFRLLIKLHAWTLKGSMAQKRLGTTAVKGLIRVSTFEIMAGTHREKNCYQIFLLTMF